MFLCEGKKIRGLVNLCENIHGEELSEAGGYDMGKMKSNIRKVFKKLGIKLDSLEAVKQWGYMDFYVKVPTGVSVKLSLNKNDEAPSEDDIENELRKSKEFVKVIKDVENARKERKKEKDKFEKELKAEKEAEKKAEKEWNDKEKKTGKEAVKKHGKMEFSSELKRALNHVMQDLRSDIHTIEISEREIPGALAEMGIDADRLSMMGYKKENKELDELFDKYGYDMVYKEALKIAKGLV